MTTLEPLVSLLKHNTDLLAPLAQFAHAFHKLCHHVEPDAQDFAHAEHLLLEHTRLMSCPALERLG